MDEDRYLALTPEQFNAEVEAIYDRLFHAIIPSDSPSYALNLRTSLYAVASLAGYLFSLLPPDAREPIGEEFEETRERSRALGDAAIELTEHEGTKH